MELKITKEEFEILSSEKRIKLMAICYELLETIDGSIILSCVDIKSSNDLTDWLRSNWGIIQEAEKMYLP